MNIAQEVIKNLLQIEPKLKWAAFMLSGFGDDFHGFECIEAYVDNQNIKNSKYYVPASTQPEAKSVDDNTEFFKEFDKVLNNESYQNNLISSILPAGVYFKSVGGGACCGILLILCIPAVADKVIEIPKSSLALPCETTIFNVTKGFKGYLLSFINSEVFGPNELEQ